MPALPTSRTKFAYDVRCRGELLTEMPVPRCCSQLVPPGFVA